MYVHISMYTVCQFNTWMFHFHVFYSLFTIMFNREKLIFLMVRNAFPSNLPWWISDGKLFDFICSRGKIRFLVLACPVFSFSPLKFCKLTPFYTGHGVSRVFWPVSNLWYASSQARSWLIQTRNFIERGWNRFCRKSLDRKLRSYLKLALFFFFENFYNLSMKNLTTL